ncbi:hypothetical protein [Salinimicrobium xinjiangense]|uniref:hypothetical protein n=1 Tax=Salinimicrobium xinjiangense TaxID=438596 RepID=UPI000426DD7B|nr:hypothetical protein [Salinimicrobium xinjiangense]
MKNYCFRAVYFKNRQDGEVDYRSVPISEAEELYDTIGVYDLSEGKENIEQNHIADMPREEFQLVLDSRFPNGFESWQKSHYEIVSALNEQSFQKSKSFYSLALQLTNKFESLHQRKTPYNKDLPEGVKRFVDLELKSNRYKLALFKDLITQVSS